MAHLTWCGVVYTSAVFGTCIHPVHKPFTLWTRIKNWIERTMSSSPPPPPLEGATDATPSPPKTPLDLAKEATSAARSAHSSANSLLMSLERQRDDLNSKIDADYGPDKAFIALHDQYVHRR